MIETRIILLIKNNILLFTKLVACIALMAILMAPNVSAADGDYLEYDEIFDPDYYAENNPDVVKVVGTNPNALFNHFVIAGMSEGRKGCEDFDVTAYMTRYPDLKEVYGDNKKMYYVHFATIGKAEGRDGTSLKDIALQKIKIDDSDYILAQYSNNGVPLYSMVSKSRYTEYKLCPYAAAIIDYAGITPEMSEKEKADNLAIYLAEYATYGKHVDGKYSFLSERKGVCHDYSVEFNSFCRMLGLESYYIVNWSDNHAWNVVLIDGIEYYYDVTWISCNKKSKYAKSKWLGTTFDVFYADGKHTVTDYKQNKSSYNNSFGDTIDFKYNEDNEFRCSYLLSVNM